MESVAARLAEAATEGGIPMNNRTGTMIRPPPSPTMVATAEDPAARASIPAYVQAPDAKPDPPYASSSTAEAARTAAATAIALIMASDPPTRVDGPTPPNLPKPMPPPSFRRGGRRMAPRQRWALPPCGAGPAPGPAPRIPYSAPPCWRRGRGRLFEAARRRMNK